MKHISHPNDVTVRDLLLTIRLFEGETLFLKPLAEECGVSVRTLQRLAPVLGDRLHESHVSGNKITDNRELLPTLKQFAPHALPLWPPKLVTDYEEALQCAMNLMNEMKKE